MASRKSLEPKLALEVIDRALAEMLDTCDLDTDTDSGVVIEKLESLAKVAKRAAEDGKRYRVQSESTNHKILKQLQELPPLAKSTRLDKAQVKDPMPPDSIT